jgi:hypothetical protein
MILHRRSAGRFLADVCLALLVPLLAAQTVKLKVSAEIANIRRGPDIGTTLLRQLPEGTILESDGREGDWFRVRLTDENGRPLSGYVHKSLVVRLLQPPPVETPPAPERPVDKEPVPPEPERTAPRPALRTVAPASSHRRFAIEISGGGGFIAGGDPNEAVQGLADFYQARFGLAPDGRVGSARLGPSAGVSMDYWFHPRVGVGAAVEFVYAGDEVMLAYRGGGTSAALEIVPEIDAVPVRAHLALAPGQGVVLKAGLEYHFARCRYLYRLTQSGARTEWTGSARAGGFGLYASASLERPVAGPLFVFGELAARRAGISGFEGTATLTTPDGAAVNEEGPLYFYTERVGPDATATLLFVREQRPGGPGISAARLARLDFSGAALRVGLRVRF